MEKYVLEILLQTFKIPHNNSFGCRHIFANERHPEISFPKHPSDSGLNSLSALLWTHSEKENESRLRMLSSFAGKGKKFAGADRACKGAAEVL